MVFFRKYARICWLTVLTTGIGIASAAADGSFGTTGTVGFVVTSPITLHNGPNVKEFDVSIIEIPGLANVTFGQDSNACGLTWKWDKNSVKDALRLDVLFPNLPGKERYHLLYTWDADAGLFYGYFNGVPMRMPGTVVDPWTMRPGTEIKPDFGDWHIENLQIYPEYVSRDEAVERVPADLLNRHGHLMGKFTPRKPLDVNDRRGRLLYESSLADGESVAGWVAEGPAIITHEDGWMKMASQFPNGPKGNIVHWAPPNFPDRFVAEWEMQLISEEGLCIVFISARGRNGEDLFDPGLPERDGVFRKYTRGVIDTYHISYYTNNPSSRPGRVTSNLRKNHGFYLATIGPAGIPTGSKDVHKIRLIRDRDHIQLLVDGKVIINYVDDGETYGPVHGDGKLGFRQMKWTVGRYRNLRVWKLKKASS